jgi:hypothetical protein
MVGGSRRHRSECRYLNRGSKPQFSGLPFVDLGRSTIQVGDFYEHDPCCDPSCEQMSRYMLRRRTDIV